LRNRINMDDKNLLEKGFTLIELLVVVVILGILAAVAIFAVGNLTDNAAKNACAMEASTVETAADAWKAQNGTYPTMTQLVNGDSTATPPRAALLKTDPKHDVGGTDGFTYTAATGVVARGSGCQA
jgi:general secretion pathway protein G